MTESRPQILGVLTPRLTTFLLCVAKPMEMAQGLLYSFLSVFGCRQQFSFSACNKSKDDMLSYLSPEAKGWRPPLRVPRGCHPLSPALVWRHLQDYEKKVESKGPCSRKVPRKERDLEGNGTFPYCRYNYFLWAMLWQCVITGK